MVVFCRKCRIPKNSGARCVKCSGSSEVGGGGLERLRHVGRVGSGGFAHIDRVEDGEGTSYALKWVNLLETVEGVAATRDTYEREVHALRKLAHPNIVRTIDEGAADGELLYLLLEWLPDTLGERERRLSLQEVSQLGVDLASALTYLDEQRVEHRDIHPGNIAFDEMGRAKLLDFGLAGFRAGGTKKHRSKLIRGYGCPGYAPVEQLIGGVTGPSGDLYALGAVLYEALAERRHLEGNYPDTTPEALAKWYAQRVRPLPRDPERPPAFEELVLRCLRVAPQERPQSAAHVLLRLRLIAGWVQVGETPDILSHDLAALRSAWSKAEEGLETAKNLLRSAKGASADAMRLRAEAKAARTERDALTKELPALRARAEAARAELAKLDGGVAAAQTTLDHLLAQVSAPSKPRRRPHPGWLAALFAIAALAGWAAFGSPEPEAAVVDAAVINTPPSERVPDASPTVAETRDAARIVPPKRETQTWVPSTDERPLLRLIEGGTFEMGSPKDNELADGDEHPVRTVEVGAFWMAETEVTQAQYHAVRRKRPSEYGKCDDCPVQNVSWVDAVVYCDALSKAEGLTECYAASACRDEGTGCAIDPGCDGYRLPTEAEWAYAARAGTTGDYYYDDLDSIAVYGSKTKRPATVKSERPNAWKLYDMLGNVWEWTGDVYGPYRRPHAPPTTGGWRVIRGGAFGSPARRVRAADRVWYWPGDRRGNLGFRVVRRPRP